MSRTPPEQPSDEADKKQLEMARQEGEAYHRSLLYMAQEVADSGGQHPPIGSGKLDRHQRARTSGRSEPSGTPPVFGSSAHVHPTLQTGGETLVVAARGCLVAA